MGESWTIDDLGDHRLLLGAGVALRVPYSVAFVQALAQKRPGIDLVDELLRSEYPPYVQRRIELLLSAWSKNERAGWRALDFGCGPGASSVALARLGIGKIVGVDLVNEYASLWARRLAEAGFPHVGTFVQAGETLALPFAGGAFDAVFLNGVLEHLTDRERGSLLIEAWRLVRRGGRLFISETPNRFFPRNSHTKIWGSELMPFSLAARYARRFGKRADFPRLTSDEASRTALWRTGFRGLAKGRISRALGPDAHERRTPEELAQLEFTLPRNPLDAEGGRRRALSGLAWIATRALAAVSGRPPSHFAPHLNLIFEKQ